MLLLPGMGKSGSKLTSDINNNGGDGDLEGQVFDMSASLRDACLYPYVRNSRRNDFRCIYL